MFIWPKVYIFILTFITCYALYSVPVRQATISLPVLLSWMSPSKTSGSLLDSSVTTLCRDFHPSIRAFPSYQKNKGSPKTADIYLSVPLLWSFLVDLALSSALNFFICPKMDFLSLS